MLGLWAILNGTAVLLVSAWVSYQIYYRLILRLCMAIPSAQPSYPLLGNILSFACSIEKMTEFLLEVMEKSVLGGLRAVCFWLGFHPLIIIADPSDIKKVLNNSLNRGIEMEESCKAYMKHGLVTSPVDHWKITRRHLNLSFQRKPLEQLMPMFNSSSRRLVADLSGHVDGAAFDLNPLVMSAALRSICAFIFGPAAVEGVSDEHFEDLRQAVDLSGELMALRMTRPWLRNNIIFNVLYGKKIDFVNTAFHRILKIANSNAVQPELPGCTKEGGEENAGQGRAESTFQTILEVMLELRTKSGYITDQHVKEEMTSFFLTGTATMGASVSPCLLALACYPHIQDKVYKEICTSVSEEEDITSADLNRLTYLHQVIKETLRFFMVVPFTSRTPDKEVDLGGYTIPANKLAILFVSSAGFDPKYFPDPFKFDPDRFSASESSNDSMFMPFGRGPRNCIGKEYAIMLMKVMVVHVVREYSLSTDMDIHNLKRKFSIVITSSDGYNVYLNKRRN